MKATLEFNLPEDDSAFQLATVGPKLYSVIHDLDQHLRMRAKGDSPDMTSQDVRDLLWEFLGLHKEVEALFF